MICENKYLRRDNMTHQWTDNQREAIETIGQNMRIVACAGSGKTTTMVEHILFIC